MQKSLEEIEQEFMARRQIIRSHKKDKVSKERLPLILDIIFYGAIVGAGALSIKLLSGRQVVSSRGVYESLGVYHGLALLICLCIIICSFIWRFKISK